ncbi:MAG: hypothetical protein MUE88_11445 [Flavobacteriales bacterium]|nr:hypothetical protein [Flavobacteriales bacterium]
MHRSLLLLGIVPFLLLSSCKKEDPVEPTPTPDPAPTQFDLSLTGAQGVRMLLDGQEVSISESSTANVLSFYGADGNVVDPPALSTKRFWAALYDGNLDLERFRMTLGTLEYEGPQVTPEGMDALFTTGVRTFGIASSGAQAVQLEYVDATGVTWSTACDAQAGSAFNITEVTSGNDGLGHYVIAKAIFNATFRNCLTNATRTATGGVLVLRFRDV